MSMNIVMNDIEQLKQLFGCSIKYDTILYRNIKVTFFSDIQNDHIIAVFNDTALDLGFHNMNYKEDVQAYLDRKLDLITTFPEFPELTGSVLTYFNNGGYRDIKLSYYDRILKIFLVTGKPDEISLISESKNILYNSGLLNKELDV